MSLTREVPLEPGKAALLIIDLQNYCCKPGHGLLKDAAMQEKYKPLIDRVYKTVLPSLQNTLKACRANRGSIEVIYTYIESLTLDGRDQSLDYKITPLFVPKGHPDAKVLEEIAPEGDEILIPKTACSVFNSTNIEYVLRNLGVSQLVVTGIVSNQCVESAVRDAADRGFLVTVVEDSCAAHTPQEHDTALFNMKGFARIVKHEQIVAEICKWKSQ